MKKKRVWPLWLLFVVCVAITVVLNFKMRGAEVEYEEVRATVLSAEDVRVVNRKTGSSTTFHEVWVLYDGETCALENAHETYSYRRGATVTAYLYDGRLFANVEGVQTSTPLATVYFVFLFASFGLLFLAAIASSKKPKKQKPPQDTPTGPEL